MKAVVIGATGATGKALIESLLNDEGYTEITALGRKHLAISHAKLKSVLIDFEQPETWSKYCEADVAFACLGTTKKQAGSNAAQYTVDFTYQFVFAQQCKAAQVPHFVLLSSIGANAKSRNFYLQIKGLLEDAITDLQFESTTIVRPAGLIRPGSDRIGEQLGIQIMKAINALGLLKSYRPLHVQKLGEFLARTGRLSNPGINIVQRNRIV